VVANANADMLDRCDKELGKRVSFIFGDGQRNLATASAKRIFYLWQRPAQLGDGRATRIFYLWHQPAQLGDGSSFIFDSGGQCKCDNVQSR